MTIDLNNIFDNCDFTHEHQIDQSEWHNWFAAPFIGQWQDRIYNFGHGLELSISNDFYTDTAVECCGFDELEGNALCLQFCLSGGIGLQTSQTATPIWQSTGQAIAIRQLTNFQRLFPAANRRTQWIRIICSEDFIATLQLGGDHFPQSLDTILNPHAQGILHPPELISDPILVALRQICQCSVPGSIGRMYLEAKLLEILSLQFTNWMNGDRLVSSAFKPDEIDRLYRAKEILASQFRQPPSLLNLAREVGLNDYKLKRGFRELFQTTVLGYVQSLKLAHAERLLLDTNLSITEITYRVGYESVSYFGILFKRQFGTTPSAYRRG